MLVAVAVLFVFGVWIWEVVGDQGSEEERGAVDPFVQALTPVPLPASRTPVVAGNDSDCLDLGCSMRADDRSCCDY